MRSISVAYEQVKKQNLYWGDYICLIEAVRGRKFSTKTINAFFVKNVSSDEYDKTDVKALLAQLHIASYTLEDDHFRGKIARLNVENLKDVVVCQSP